jgi:hypothetical protein
MPWFPNFALADFAKKHHERGLAISANHVRPRSSVTVPSIRALTINLLKMMHDVQPQKKNRFLSNLLFAAFNWDSLANFEFKSNFQDFLSSDVIHSITQPESLGDMYDAMETATDAFCDKGG